MKTEIRGALATLALVLVAAPGWAQEKVGVVTTVVGPVTVARASLPPEPLKFKDDVFVRDRVTTGEAAITRILLGGKVIVTARERSTLTITETPGLSTIHLTSGRIAVAVEKSRMKPGERVDIRTPNAVAGVRGTVLIVEAETNVSTVTVLRGLVHVTRAHAVSGAPVGAFTAVGARQMVTVRNNVLPTRAKSISSGRAQELALEFRPPLKAVTGRAVVHDSDEIKGVLVRSDASVAPRAVGTAAVATGTVASTTPVAVTAPAPTAAPVAVPTASMPPVLSTTPVLATSPALSSPTPVLATAPVSVSAPTTIKTNAPNWGSSWKTSGTKEDRSGSNSGRR